MSQINVDTIKSRVGGAPTLGQGVIVSAAATFSGDISAAAASFSGSVSVGGTLTYEDVSNIDAVGLITARSGIEVTGGQILVGAAFSVGQAGVVTATSYYGDGSNLSGISAAAISTTTSSPSANTVVTLNLSTAQHHELTLSAGITTITCSGGRFGESHSVVMIQPSSGIATVGLSTYFLFPSGSSPTFSEGGSQIDLLSFVVKQVGAGGTQLLASAGLNYL